MKNKHSVSFIFASLMTGILFLAPAGTSANYSKNYTPAGDVMTLQPGWISSCQNDFVIENMGEEHANVKIKLGIEEFKMESIPKWEKRSYDLRHELTLAKQLGKTVHIDDVALIKNTSGDSDVRVHC